MGVIDRGVDFLDQEDLHRHLNDILAPFEVALVGVIIPCLMWAFVKFDIYTNFPNTLFRWILMLDWLYGFFMGPCRWLKGNPLYSSMAHPTTGTGCRFAVFIDTFCQIGLLYTNTIIVATVFVTIYFQGRNTIRRAKYNNMCKNGFWLVTLVVSIVTSVSGDVHSYVGWCSADSASVIFKQLTWFLALVFQVTMIIPTNYIVWKATKGSGRGVGSGIYLRFVSTIFTQFVGIFPVMSVEFLGLARKTVPSWIMWSVIIFFPIAHLLDAIIMSVKLWPILLGLVCKGDSCKWIDNFANSKTSSRASKGASQSKGRGSTHKGTSGSTYSHSVGSSAISISSTGSSENSSLGESMSGGTSSEGEEDGAEYSEGSGSTTGEGFTTTSGGLSSLADQMSTGNSNAYREYEKTRSNGSIFDKMPFWVHLSITIFIPLILLTFVTMLMVLEKLDFKNQAVEIEKDINLSEKISNFVHESQKERGNTGVFMGNKGQKFQCEILAQYAISTVKKIELQFYLDNEFENVRLVTKSTFLSALINMLGLEAHRENVQALSITKGAGLSFYTNMNMFFVGVVAEVCHDSTLGFTIQHKMYSNLAFFLSKEFAGIERAKGTVVFGATKDWANKNAFRTFIEVVTKQDTHDYFFQVYVQPADAKLYAETMDHESVHSSLFMQGVLLESNTTKFIPITSGQWFDNMTSKINLIREVEASLASDLTFDAEDVVNSSTQGMILVVCSLAGVLIVDGLMILGLARTSEALRKFSVGRQQKEKRRTKGCIDWLTNIAYNMNFTYQIIGSVGLCGLSLIAVSWMLLQEQVTASQAAATTWENMHLQFYFSNYIHETQKERGATGVYVGNSGQRFADVLPRQVNLTKVLKAELDLFLDEYIDFDNLRMHVKWIEWEDFVYVNGGSRRGMSVLRQQVWDLEIPASEALGYYTQHNARITDIAREVVKRASGNSIEARLLGYLGFMYMKEKAGNERAVGTVGFSKNPDVVYAGWTSIGAYRAFTQLVAIQDAAFVYFETFATDDQNALFESTKTNSGSVTAQTMRGYGLDWDIAKMTNVDAGEWYNNITEKINQWRIVEEQIATDLLDFFGAVSQKADDFLTGSVIMLLGLFVVAVYVIQKGIRLLLSSRAYMLYRERLKIARSKKKKEERKRKKQEAIETAEANKGVAV